MSAAAFVGWLDTLLGAVLAELGPDYTGEVREPTESETAPYTVWITVDQIEDNTRVADLGQTAQVAVMVFVTVLYERSPDAAHYVARTLKRLATVRGAQKACTDAPNALLCTIQDEQPFITDELYASSTAVRVEFQEDAS